MTPAALYQWKFKLQHDSNGVENFIRDKQIGNLKMHLQNLFNSLKLIFILAKIHLKRNSQQKLFNIKFIPLYNRMIF